MIMRMSKSAQTQHVVPRDILDYQSSNHNHQNRFDENELKQFERFHAARSLISQNMDTYLNAKLSAEVPRRTVTGDVCGTKNGNLTAVFCQIGALEDPLAEAIETVNQSENANVVIVLPKELSEFPMSEAIRSALENRKTTVD